MQSKESRIQRTLEGSPIKAMRKLAESRGWRDNNDSAYCANIVVDKQLTLTLRQGYRDIDFSADLRITRMDSHPITHHPHLLARKLSKLLAYVAARLMPEKLIEDEPSASGTKYIKQTMELALTRIPRVVALLRERLVERAPSPPPDRQEADCLLRGITIIGAVMPELLVAVEIVAKEVVLFAALGDVPSTAAMGWLGVLWRISMTDLAGKEQHWPNPPLDGLDELVMPNLDELAALGRDH